MRPLFKKFKSWQITCTHRTNKDEDWYITFKGQIIHVLWAQIPLKVADSLYHLTPVKSKDKAYPF